RSNAYILDSLCVRAYDISRMRTNRRLAFAQIHDADESPLFCQTYVWPLSHYKLLLYAFATPAKNIRCTSNSFLNIVCALRQILGGGALDEENSTCARISFSRRASQCYSHSRHHKLNV